MVSNNDKPKNSMIRTHSADFLSIVDNICHGIEVIFLLSLFKPEFDNDKVAIMNIVPHVKWLPIVLALFIPITFFIT